MIPKVIKYYILNVLIIFIIGFGITRAGFDITNLSKENIIAILEFQLPSKEVFIFLFMYLFLGFVRYYELDWYSIQSTPYLIPSMEYNKKWDDRKIKTLYYGKFSESFLGLYYLVYYIVLQLFNFSILGALVVYVMVLFIDFITFKYLENTKLISTLNFLLYLLFVVLSFICMKNIPDGYGDSGIFSNEFFTFPFFRIVIPWLAMCVFTVYVLFTDNSKDDIPHDIYLYGSIIYTLFWIITFVTKCRSN